MGNPFIRFMINQIQHYNHEKYWKMRDDVTNSKSNKNKLLRLYYLFRIKKMDAFNNASTGTDLGKGAKFKTPPILYHGLNGIVISHFAEIGKECVIFQRVTIAEGDNHEAPIIGDNCRIGANAVLYGGIIIGNNVKIGANAVVTKDVPDNCTIVGVPARIVKINGEKVDTLL